MRALFKYARAFFSFISSRVYLVRHLSIIIVSLVVFLLTYLVGNCAHVVGGSSGLKCSTIGIGFNGAESNCGIAHILGILLTNSYGV